MKTEVFVLTLLVAFLSVFYTPAHAYAGPGVAIGAIVVAATIIFAFLGSTILRVWSFLKFLATKVQRSVNNKASNETSINSESKDD